MSRSVYSVYFWLMLLVLIIAGCLIYNFFMTDCDGLAKLAIMLLPGLGLTGLFWIVGRDNALGQPIKQNNLADGDYDIVTYSKNKDGSFDMVINLQLTTGEADNFFWRFKPINETHPYLEPGKVVDLMNVLR